MKSLSIKSKLRLILFTPLLGLFVLCINLILNQYVTLNELGRLHQLTSFAGHVNSLVLESQAERELSAGVIGSEESRFFEALQEQRKATDVKLEGLHSYLNDFNSKHYGAPFEEAIEHAIEKLAQLPQHRLAVDSAGLFVPDAMGFYNELNHSLFQTLEILEKLSPNPQINRALSAYYYFLQGMEKVSLEHAMMSQVFNDDRYGNEFQQFSAVRAEQEVYFKVFLSFATPEFVELYWSIVQGGENSEVDQKKIQELHEIEKKMILSLGEETMKLRKEGNQTLLMIVVLTGLVFGISVVLASILSRSILVPLTRLLKATRLVTSGNTPVEIDIQSMDEIGNLAHAFNKMIEGSKEVIAQANRIAEGDYSRDVEPRSSQDALGIALHEMTKNLRKLTQENSEQNWIKTGHTELNNAMRGDLSLEELGQNTIAYLAKTVDAKIGAVYVSEDDKVLKLIGGYAYTCRKNISNRFGFGEGLVGQAALEKNPIVISDVPTDYIAVQSAIGEVRPQHILVLPILFEGTVNGVMELGTLEKFTELQMTFLNQALEDIGINLNLALIRARTHDLLNATQQQAKEMHIQQEKLRKANEVFGQQTLALRRSESQLQSQQEKLKMTNEELESQSVELRLANSELEKQKSKIEQKNQEVEEKANELATASVYKSEFLANMSHELRTPLNSLLLLADTLSHNQTGNLTRRQIEYTKIIHSSGCDLLNLINEILDLSKIEAGMMEVEIAPVSLQEVSDNLEKGFKHLAFEKGLELNLEISANLPATFSTDQKRMEQILKNLMSNAFKFTEKGKVTIDFFLSTPRKSVGISVSDTGIGIALEKQKIIFEAFQQAEGGISRKFGGTGLGLSISRQLAHLLGGHIEIQSKEATEQFEGGTIFTVYLPLDQKPIRNRPDPTEGSDGMVVLPKKDFLPLENTMKTFSIPDDRPQLKEGERTVLLIIEDDPNFAKILMDQCHGNRFRCLITPNGEEGLELAEQFLPDGIILDIHLPGIDGWNVLQALKENPNTCNIPVHIMSVDDERHDAESHGAIGFVAKPVSQKQLDNEFQKIQSYIDQEIKSLLIIEDDEATRFSIKSSLENKYLKITEASCGEEGFEALISGNFDCVILDMGLNDMSGLELLEKLAEKRGRRIPPIVVYTGQDLSSKERQDLQQYADSIIIKGPDSEERLLDKTALFLHRVAEDLPIAPPSSARQIYDPESVFKNKKVLVVDDDLRNLYAITQILDEKGINVLTAGDGSVALNTLETEGDVDLVLMDVMMSSMSGYETTRAIRLKKKFKKLPIISLTAKAMKNDRAKCIAAGANDYISKPVDAQRLFAILRIWLYN